MRSDSVRAEPLCPQHWKPAWTSFGLVRKIYGLLLEEVNDNVCVWMVKLEALLDSTASWTLRSGCSPSTRMGLLVVGEHLVSVTCAERERFLQALGAGKAGNIPGVTIPA